MSRSAYAADLSIFLSYAARVKSINHRHRRPIDPAILSLLQCSTTTSHVGHLLPSLTTVQVAVPGWDAFTSILGLSSNLQQLNLDLGFNKARTDAKGWSNDAVAAKYLTQVARITSLQHLELRGLALGSEGINLALISMKSLRTLNLTTGNSLSARTFVAIAAFPHLAQLEVHAGHIDADEFADLDSAGSAPLFPTLQHLRIRAQASLMEVLLQNMPTNTLKSLILEAERSAQPPSSWNTALELIALKSAQSLREFTMEHHIDVDVLETDSNPQHNTVPHTNSRFTLATLSPLAKLSHLIRFVLDSTLPPDLCDTDVGELVKWWPDIKHLDLGGLITPADCIEPFWKPRMSLGCLELLARHCQHLEAVVLNVDLNLTAADSKAPTPVQHALRSLTLGSCVPPDPVTLPNRLQNLFPSLKEVDGVALHEEEWVAIYSKLNGTLSQAPDSPYSSL